MAVVTPVRKSSSMSLGLGLSNAINGGGSDSQDMFSIPSIAQQKMKSPGASPMPSPRESPQSPAPHTPSLASGSDSQCNGTGGAGDNLTDILAKAKALKYRKCKTVYDRWPGTPAGLLMMNKIWEYFAVYSQHK